MRCPPRSLPTHAVCATEQQADFLLILFAYRTSYLHTALQVYFPEYRTVIKLNSPLALLRNTFFIKESANRTPTPMTAQTSGRLCVRALGAGGGRRHRPSQSRRQAAPAAGARAGAGGGRAHRLAPLGLPLSPTSAACKLSTECRAAAFGSVGSSPTSDQGREN